MHLSGPRLLGALRSIAAECERNICPLTPELFTQWLGETGTRLAREPQFYVRVLDYMAPEIPAWPPGSTREGAENPIMEAIDEALASWLRQSGERPGADNTLTWLRAQPRFAQVSVCVFLAALRRARNVIVDFPSPERIEIRLRRLRIADYARIILGESTVPLTPEEIIALAHGRFGPGSIIVTGRSAGNALKPDRGYYLLGPRAVGLRQHFHSTETNWSALRTAFERLLQVEKRPMSTVEAVDQQHITVPHGVNSYELAEIVREDPRFIDLGRRLFALAEWGVQERDHIKDLLPRVFAEAGRALRIEQTYERLTRFRSLSATGLSNIMRVHPAIRSFGLGYFGLKDWGNAETEVILRDRVAVERAVRRSELPTSFAALCEMFGAPIGSRRADLLWKTCEGSEKLRRAPDQPGADTLLLHKTVSLETALAAVLRAVGRPAPAYELEWELAAKYGAIFARHGLPQIEQRLARNPRFLRNAASEFLLDVDSELEDFDLDALRTAATNALRETRDIAGCDDLLDRLELQGFDIEDLSVDMLGSVLRVSEGLQEVGHNRFRAK